MEPHKIGGVKFNLTVEYKGGTREIEEVMPMICNDKDYAIQYIGIWKILIDRVLEMKAKKVLEFGTRDGYSTRIFAEALKMTDGHIFTVDKDEPKNKMDYSNICTIRSQIEELEWNAPVDILYIDDWHNGKWLYSELERFAKFAKVVMIHDVCLDPKLLEGVIDWCHHNMMIWTVYPMNGCGLAVIEVDKSNSFYANENKPTGEQ